MHRMEWNVTKFMTENSWHHFLFFSFFLDHPIRIKHFTLFEFSFPFVTTRERRERLKTDSELAELQSMNDSGASTNSLRGSTNLLRGSTNMLRGSRSRITTTNQSDFGTAYYIGKHITKRIECMNE